ncbi:MAG: pyroglutamyl-peptidase I [Microbacterium sp.]|nr:pyroglutamyl-peptidase I [Microbacterium sp.]MBA4345641.1 pyroglutamyl-peptidase I [Microbacterium sp.]
MNARADHEPVVLVTGFEPFAGAPVNPSGELVRRLIELGHPDCRIVGEVLPVSFDRAAGLLAAAIEAHNPDIVIALGLAESRHAITPERVAINLADAPIADNDGDQPRDAEIEHGGPAARFTGLPVKAIAHALDAAGIPSDISLTAGSYVCNHVFYQLMGLAAARPGLRAGFIHVPATPQLGGSPQFTLDELERGIRIAITTTLSMRDDVAHLGGSTH